MTSHAERDVWADWLRRRRSGGSEQARRATLEWLAPIRDEVLDQAHVGPGDVLLDVGCGDGLIGLGALERGAHVVFSDVSQACLDDCRAIAGPAAEYRLAPATDLGDVEADVVTTRSVLIYVADKLRAFSEFFRVLRPGGRLSIFEPINRFGLEEQLRTFGFRDVGMDVETLLGRVAAAMEPEGCLDPMIDFDERDLLRLAEDAGLVDIRLKYVAEVTESPPEWRPRDWDVFLDTAPNPLARTMRESIEAVLTPAEAATVESVLRPQVEAGIGTTRVAHAFLSARKPSR
jgi:SAM-dependent methyltransferase